MLNFNKKSKFSSDAQIVNLVFYDKIHHEGLGVMASLSRDTDLNVARHYTQFGSQDLWWLGTKVSVGHHNSYQQWGHQAICETIREPVGNQVSNC